MELKIQIQQRLQIFSQGNLHDNALALLNTLGYDSEKALNFDNSSDTFLDEFDKHDRKLKYWSKKQDWNGWIAFFLQAITHQAKGNSTRTQAIMSLYENMKNTIHNITHSQYSVYLLNAIFNKPIFKISDYVTQIAGKFMDELLEVLEEIQMDRYGK